MSLLKQRVINNAPKDAFAGVHALSNEFHFQSIRHAIACLSSWTFYYAQTWHLIDNLMASDPDTQADEEVGRTSQWAGTANCDVEDYVSLLSRAW